MADTEQIGIDWKPILQKIDVTKEKVIFFNREDANVFDVNTDFSITGEFCIMIFETENDNNLAIVRKSVNSWGLKGKGKIKPKAWFYIAKNIAFPISKPDSRGSLLNNDLTLNLSIDRILNINNSAQSLTNYAQFQNAYSTYDIDTFPPSTIDGYLLLRYMMGLINKELLNPDGADVSIFNDFAFGINADIWDGIREGSWYGKPYAYSYWKRPRGGYTGSFKEKIESDVYEIKESQLNANNYIFNTQFQQPSSFMVAQFGDDYNLLDFKDALSRIFYPFISESTWDSQLSVSNSFVYVEDGQFLLYYSNDNAFISPPPSEWLWGWLNGLNCMVFSSEDYESNESQSDEYIANPLEFTPENAQATTTDDNGTPTTTTNETTQPDDSANQKDDDKDKTEFPNTWDATTCARVYEVTRSDLQTFVNYFWGNGVTQDAELLPFLQGLYGNLSEAILSVSFIPCILDITKSQRVVKVGRLTTGFTWDAIADTVVSKEMGEIKVKPQSKKRTYFDYAPYTSIKLYLPYLGIIDLDTNVYMDTILSVRLIVDILTGDSTYCILSDGTMCDTFTFQLGAPITFTLSNGSNITASKLNNAINCTTSAVNNYVNSSNGVRNMGINTQDLINVSVPAYSTKGALSGASSLGNAQRMILFIKRPIYNRPSNYGKMVGYPYNKTSTLKSLNGYTVCENAKIEKFKSKPTNSEYEEIIELLERGVIL